jgi:hypothetical protein
MDAWIEQKRAATNGDPEREAKTWLEKVCGEDQERRGYQRLAAKGHMTEEELNEALLELDEIRKAAERELETLKHRQEEVEALERDRDALLASWSAAVPGDLERLTPEGRNRLYHMLRLEISPTEAGYEITGPFYHGSSTSSTPHFLSRFPRR